ncbi:hypothetical protein EXIGLDRAFT_492834 [Exidia glandulosa HHB12029]|nr:hypothetical protein EXIGLDRAFT_492834 [Exidia glandulosa HHB12029]
MHAASFNQQWVETSVSCISKPRSALLEQLRTDITALHTVYTDALERQRRFYAEKTNALVPVQNIPEDVLVEIFALLGYIDRLRATWVCRHWRQKALLCAMLWSEISLGPADDLTLLSMMLHRNKEASLSLHLTRPFEDIVDILDTLSVYRDRIQQLDLVL